MFENSTAIVQTRDKNWFVHMHNLMRQAGFKDTRRFPNNGVMLTEFRHGPLPFIFMHSTVPIALARDSVLLVRNHAEISLRFIPIILISDGCDATKLLHFVQLGFDDIISMPVTAALLLGRLKLQLDTRKNYHQTDAYFGPDLYRYRSPESNQHSLRGKGGQFYKHFIIERHYMRGTTILSTDMHYATNKSVSRKPTVV